MKDLFLAFFNFTSFYRIYEPGIKNDLAVRYLHSLIGQDGKKDRKLFPLINPPSQCFQ